MGIRGLNRNMMAAMLAGGLAVAGLHVQQSQAGVVITNDGFTTSNLALPNSPNYGSNVAAAGENCSVFEGGDGVVGAPQIALEWIGSGGKSGNGYDTYINWDGRGNVIQLDDVVSSESLGGRFEIRFTPASGYGVRIDSFDLDAWVGGGDMAVDWSITGQNSVVLASGNWTKDNAGGRDTILAGVDGSIGEMLSLNLVRTGGDPVYLAMDNLKFDQLNANAIPEPATMTLLGLGGLVALRRRHR